MFQLILPFQLELPFDAGGHATTRASGTGAGGSRQRAPRPKRPRPERPQCHRSMDLFLEPAAGHSFERDV